MPEVPLYMLDNEEEDIAAIREAEGSETIPWEPDKVKLRQPPPRCGLGGVGRRLGSRP